VFSPSRSARLSTCLAKRHSTLHVRRATPLDLCEGRPRALALVSTLDDFVCPRLETIVVNTGTNETAAGASETPPRRGLFVAHCDGERASRNRAGWPQGWHAHVRAPHLRIIARVPSAPVRPAHADPNAEKPVCRPTTSFISAHRLARGGRVRVVSCPRLQNRPRRPASTELSVRISCSVGCSYSARAGAARRLPSQDSRPDRASWAAASVGSSAGATCASFPTSRAMTTRS
jgi:hypothetical protein